MSKYGVISAPYFSVFSTNTEKCGPEITLHLDTSHPVFIDDLFMTWVGSQQEFLEFMSNLNKKQPSIKFEFKYSQTKIESLDILVYKDQNNVLQTTIYRKQTDRQNFLDAQSEHPKLLKDNIPCSQVLQRENKF